MNGRRARRIRRQAAVIAQHYGTVSAKTVARRIRRIETRKVAR